MKMIAKRFSSSSAGVLLESYQENLRNVPARNVYEETFL